MTNIVDSLKSLVKEKYAEIANSSKQQNSSSCCGTTSCCGDGSYTIKIKPGDTVIIEKARENADTLGYNNAE